MRDVVRLTLYGDTFIDDEDLSSLEYLLILEINGEAEATYALEDYAVQLGAWVVFVN